MRQNRSATSETNRRRSFERRILVIHGFLFLACILIIARLIELQILKKNDYRFIAQAQQYGGVRLPAKRGEILSRNSKTGDTSILATNTTLDLLYIDPQVIQSSYAEVADTLADILITKATDALCRKGDAECPTELTGLYKDAFDPIKQYATHVQRMAQTLGTSGSTALALSGALAYQSISPANVPDITEIRRLFARSIEERIRDKNVMYVPLLFGANKLQKSTVLQLNIPGIVVNDEQDLIYCNPEQVNQEEGNLQEVAHKLSPILIKDPGLIRSLLVRRQLRYVPIMGKLSAEKSAKIRKVKEESSEKTRQINIERKKVREPLVKDPYRAIALVPEHWRYYPDTHIASHVIGFIIAKERGQEALQEPQYGIERAYDNQLRGQEGRIDSVSDPFGGQIISSDQKFIDPRDGSSIVLTIDRFIQNHVEELLETMVKKVDAESGQVIIIDPFTGKILAMANAPRFDNNTYASVYEKEPIIIPTEKEGAIVVEILNPETNTRILTAYLKDLAPENRAKLPMDIQQKITDLEKLYNRRSYMRYYLYAGGENNYNKREIFPTEYPTLWLKYKNNIGVGSYVNRTIQEIYEPGSVMKAITMAIAIDQGEVVPDDTYDDNAPVKVDEFTIKNALFKYYGRVNMVQCIDFSLNTCLQYVAQKLGRKLFFSELQKFGFGQVTGIELDNELSGELKDWRNWSNALTSTTGFGQGVSVTPLQMIKAWAPLANGGKLMKPTIIDEIRNADGTLEKRQPIVLGQVIKPETSATITAMLTHSGEYGFAKAGKPKNYRIAGKTGTSQIAGPGGKYEVGTGSTIATFAGYAPVDHPKFMILVKLDRPKKDDFGSKSAAPLFKDIASFLFDYYGIPPDEPGR